MMAPIRPIMSPGPISTAKAHLLSSQMMRPSGQVYYTWDDVKDKNRYLAIFEPYVFMLDHRSNRRFLASSVSNLRTRPATSF